MNNSRNLLLAFVLSGLLILGWDVGMRYFYPQPETQAAQRKTPPGGVVASGEEPGAVEGTSVVAGDLTNGTPATGPVDLSAALADPQRVVIEAPRIAGSINLVGARIDDIVLKDHRETTDKDSGPVRLFAPERTFDEYFAEFGFLVNAKRSSSQAVWSADGDKLTPDRPVTLTRRENDLTYSIKLTVDEDYMITAEQSVTNAAEEAAAVVQPFALIKRSAIPGANADADPRYNASPDEFLSHAGPVGVFDDVLNDPHAYHELAELKTWSPTGSPDWLGFSDRYWLGALVPGESAESATFRSLKSDLFRADVLYTAQTLAPGATLTQSTRLYAGAKDSVILDRYEDGGISQFGKAISWGWFEIIEKPLLWLLRTLNGLIGNFGVAIIGMTLVIRGLLFPIAQKQFSSMAQMKAVQPKMKAIQERYKDDKQTQQQKIMELYKEEKVNPLAGCLPLVIQIPIFFALYKVLILAIEMRHEPFLYIRDLTAPDPATILNLFGVLPYEVPGFLGIGVLAVLLGVTMWLTFKLNPSTMDPMQQQIFNLMPWFLMFVMAPFAAGLLLYWVTSNILTLAQQKYLYSRHPQLKAAAEKEKAEMAQKAEREKAEKSKA
ncbi:MAG: membrane protein insertase YidC [Erythrobacter sp.]|uniref:membrane protein insertase YidC n=1 Tax=Erythrobacter sp. TaxID=1042 RepID=UPI00260C8179|nr:membrane protein insertase YidC [Erythrobacter sp.]MDJ0979332.1 membrane protein insertase YidC [Erythrobacter sp.]